MTYLELKDIEDFNAVLEICTVPLVFYEFLKCEYIPLSPPSFQLKELRDFFSFQQVYLALSSIKVWIKFQQCEWVVSEVHHLPNSIRILHYKHFSFSLHFLRSIQF